MLANICRNSLSNIASSFGIRFIFRMAPRKRKSSESMSPAAIKKRKQREKETAEKKEARLTKQRHRTAQNRANETEEQRKHRLNQNSQRNRDSRAEETREQIKNRRQANRQNLAKKRKERKLKKGNLYLAGFKYVSSANYPPDSAGEMNEVCVHCQALRFKNEVKGICCLNGQIQLPSIDDPPEPFYSYLVGKKRYKKFITNILTYNSCFQFTSSLTQNQTLPKIGSILPIKKEDSKNLQIYFMSDDENEEAQQRCANVQGIETKILLDLQRILQQENQIVKLFKNALEKMPSDDYNIILPPDRTISSHEKQKEKQFPTIDDSLISNTQEDSYKGALVIPKRDPGPKSFDALKTVGVQKCETYKEACEKRGLIIREETWETTLQEAIDYSSTAEQCRSLFSIILSFSKPSNPTSLWDKFKGNFSKDIKNRRKEEKFIEALKQIENKCMLMNGKTIKDLNLNSQTGSHESDAQDYEYNREMNYDITKLRESFKKDKPRLKDEQRSVFDAIQEQMTSEAGGLFFLDAPGGTGKTFLLNMLLTKIRMQKKIALALASTGLAASLHIQH
ncbi:ATP-dependent DNA helicase PIF7 [Biomphalaria pfeifferi]|uniref:ATP-dependent DNA helicase n=1 Tax=Biomphalaria pfeifferi TaxID=112525 RepID=A0AAD8FAR1_BIOPF|nr:ATP-dependent DNA helicase PIF7 [Biomphalaria pfeifferi]